MKATDFPPTYRQAEEAQISLQDSQNNWQSQQNEHRTQHHNDHHPDHPTAQFLAGHTAQDLRTALEHLADHQTNHTSERPELDLAHLPMMRQQLENATAWLQRALEKADQKDITGALTEMEDLRHDTIHAATHPASHLTAIDHLRANWPATADALETALNHSSGEPKLPEFMDPTTRPGADDRQMLLNVAQAHQLTAEGWSEPHASVQAQRLVRNLTHAMGQYFPHPFEVQDQDHDLKAMASEITGYVHQVTMATLHLTNQDQQSFANALETATAHARSAINLTTPVH